MLSASPSGFRISEYRFVEHKQMDETEVAIS